MEMGGIERISVESQVRLIRREDKQMSRVCSNLQIRPLELLSKHIKG